MRKIAIVLFLIVCYMSLTAVQTGIAFADTDNIETETYYIGGNGIELLSATIQKDISFPGSYKNEISSTYVANKGPVYYNTNDGIENCCANVAGSILLGFYDRYNEALIPNVSSFSSSLNRYLPMAMIETHVQNVTNDLYTRMGTNTIKPGTSEKQFFTGLSSYCTSKNAILTQTSILSNGKINMQSLQQCLRENKPIAVFSKVYNTMAFSLTDSKISVSVCDVPHIFIVVGYAKYGVYDSNNQLVETFEALLMSDGIGKNYKSLYVNYDYLDLDNAYRIDIT